MTRLLYEMTTSISISRFIQSRTEQGYATTLFEITGYNELASDSDVGVAAYIATRVTNPDEPPEEPTWSGDDEWYPFADTVDSSAGTVPRAKYVAYEAYVTSVGNDAWLVARFHRFQVGPVVALHGIVTAKVVPIAGGGYVLAEGQVGGRLPIGDVIAGLEYMNPAGDPICTNTSKFDDFVAAVCLFADISASGVDDGSAPCDAISIGARFTTKPVRLGPVSPLVDLWGKRCEGDTSPKGRGCASSP
jgi:hypothetical protein